LTEVMITSFLARFARSAAFFHTAPLVGDSLLPSKARTGCAAAIAIALAPVLPPVNMELLPVIIPAEILLGALAGFVARVVIAGIEAGGQLIALNFALGLSATFDPTVGESAVVTRRMALVVSLLAFLFAGGLESCVRVIAIAPNSEVTLVAALVAVIKQTDDILVVALRFAAPAMIAGLVGYLGVALLSKASPAFNLFSIMLPALLVIGGFVLILTAPQFVRDIEFFVGRLPDEMARTFGL